MPLNTPEETAAYFADKPEPYQGWTNYETWTVHAWITTSEDSQDYWQEQAVEALGDATEAGSSLRLTPHELAILALAEKLKSQYEESAPELEDMWADLLGSAMSEVNWREIAKHFVDSAQEEINSETDDDDWEPADGDLVTMDHVHFNEFGDTHNPVLIINEDAEESMESQLKHFMDRNLLWPNVWFISDHGNAILMNLDD